MTPSEVSTQKQSTPEMETKGTGEHSIQNMNVTSVTNLFTIFLGQVRDEEPIKEGINDADREYSCDAPICLIV